MKLNAALFLIGCALGLAGGYKLFKSGVSGPIKEKLKVTEIKKKNGEVIKITEKDSIPALKKYGVGLYHDKTIFGEVRLGDMPLFLIGETDFNQLRVGVKLEF